MATQTLTPAAFAVMTIEEFRNVILFRPQKFDLCLKAESQILARALTSHDLVALESALIRFARYTHFLELVSLRDAEMSYTYGRVQGLYQLLKDALKKEA